MMLVGEQPGDQEDKAGAPFVGPAGKLLDKALAAAGVDRDRLYVTNAVKHFKFTVPERGKRRIHKTPSRTEVVACRPWLLAEMESVRPDVVVFLGATAAQSLLGSTFRLTAHRGEVLHLPAADDTTDVDGRPRGRTVLDWAHDGAELLDLIEVGLFAVMGRSMADSMRRPWVGAALPGHSGRDHRGRIAAHGASSVRRTDSDEPG
jgi:uracil-DNA glycosylase family 4